MEEEVIGDNKVQKYVRKVKISQTVHGIVLYQSL